MDHERVTVIYSGTVQGVGFRWQTTRALKEAVVTGFVRNRSDGAVELVVEGSPEAIRDAMARVESALGHLIADQTESTSPATGEFADFRIRR